MSEVARESTWVPGAEPWAELFLRRPRAVEPVVEAPAPARRKARRRLVQVRRLARRFWAADTERLCTCLTGLLGLMMLLRIALG